ncbi:MAG: SPOR domain-containing protein [Bacteroidetes bacterium]|nr:SPOR domain-containing protein [Bacteroidota bacterium]
MKQLLGCLIFLLLPVLSFSQTDSTAASTPEDTTSVFLNPKAPMVPPYDINFFLGPDTAKKSIFPAYEEFDYGPGMPVFNPKISLGTGMLSFYGDLYKKHYQSPWTSRVGYDLNVSHRLNRYLMINFNLLFGKLGAYENLPNRHENFQSEIRAGGINLLYDFGNFIPDRYRIRPFVSLGITSFEFLSKTDLYDRNGEKYHYWSDGSIKNMEEGSAGSQFAKDLVRDYRYETDIRELNADGFGKYPERAWAVPFGFGAIMHITERFDFKMGVQYYFTNTDYIDGITNKSVGNRAGTKAMDKFVYTSVSLQYDLVLNRKKKDTLPAEYYDNLDWLAIDNADYDKDGVRDWDDNCQGTPEGVKVDKFGCPLDEDMDGVPDYRDEELPSPKGFEVNLKGIALTDEFWQDWYDHYFDSVGIDRTTEQIGNAFDLVMPKTNKKKKKEQRSYTVELARYAGGVPSDEMAYLLSIGDMKSTVLDDGTTVVYTAGTYEEVKQAAKRRDEFMAEGNKKAMVGYFKNDKYSTMTEEELQAAIKESDLEAANNATQTAVTSGTIAANNNNQNNQNNNQGNETGNNANNNQGNETGNNVNNANNNQGNETGNTTGNNTANASGTTTASSGGNETGTSSGSANFEKGSVVYRVQLGAYKNKISTAAFKNSDVVELKTEDNYFRYVTNGYKTLQEAASKRADLVLLGYTDAFVTAYKDGKRIAMEKAGATMETKQKEDLNESKTFSTIDKSLISFKLQIGALKRPAASADMDEKTKDLQGVEKQTTSTGMIRYSIGSYKEYQKAEEARKQLEDKGFPEAFIIAIFKDEIISLQEAMELLK